MQCVGQLSDRLRSEAQILGASALLTPLAVVSASAALGILAVTFASDGAGHLVVVGFEMCLAIAVGVLASAASASDPAIEVLLSIRARYQTTIYLRFALITLWASLLAGAASTLLLAMRIGPVPGQVQALAMPFAPLASQLVWLSPLLWCSAMGAFLSALLRSRSASAALLGGIWAGEVIFFRSFSSSPALRPFFLFVTTFDPSADYWLTNRLELIGTAVVLLVCIWLLIRKNEILFRSSKGDSA